MIKTHKELAEFIAGKKILHLNSLGKDSIVCLEWLTVFARPAEVKSIYFNFLAEHPDDVTYMNYLIKRYPSVHFMHQPNPIEISIVLDGDYQWPTRVNHEFNHFEYDTLEFWEAVEEARVRLECDYVCVGQSKYESFARASKFYRSGLVDEKKKQIFPIGMFTKDQVMSVIRNNAIKLHPSYKFSKSTLDHPSYWKMKRSFQSSSAYRNRVMAVYPLIALDEYRHEVLFKK